MERPQAPLFVGQIRRLRQVLSCTLLNNAVKFTDQGVVTLRLKAMPAAGAR